MTFVSDRKRIAKNTVFLYIRMLFVMIIAFYTSRVILQSLGAVDYGIYNVVGGIVLMMAFIIGPLNGTTMRFLTVELGRNHVNGLSRIFACTLNIHIVIGIITILLGETIGLWFFYEKLIMPPERMETAFWVYQFSIITAVFTFTQIPYSATLTAHENMSIYAYVGLYEAISNLIIAFLISISEWDKLLLYALLIMLNKVAILIFYRIYTGYHYQECHFHLFWDKKLYSQIISYAGWNLFGGLAVVSEGQGINILLNVFFGPIVNAARAIAVQIQSAVTMFVQNILTAVKPQVIKNYANKQYSEMYNLAFQTTKYSYYLLFLIILPIMTDIEVILEIWLGKSVPEQTDIFVMIVLVTTLVNSIDQTFLMTFHAIGKVKFGNIVGGSFMIMSLPICYFVLKYDNPSYSVFIVIFLINLLSTIFDFFLVHYYIWFSVSSFIKETLIPMIIFTILSLLTPFLIIYFFDESILRLVLNILISDLVSLFVIWFFGINRYERSLLKHFVVEKILKFKHI